MGSRVFTKAAVVAVAMGLASSTLVTGNAQATRFGDPVLGAGYALSIGVQTQVLGFGVRPGLDGEREEVRVPGSIPWNVSGSNCQNIVFPMTAMGRMNEGDPPRLWSVTLNLTGPSTSKKVTVSGAATYGMDPEHPTEYYAAPDAIIPLCPASNPTGTYTVTGTWTEQAGPDGYVHAEALRGKPLTFTMTRMRSVVVATGKRTKKKTTLTGRVLNEDYNAIGFGPRGNVIPATSGSVKLTSSRWQKPRVKMTVPVSATGTFTAKIKKRLPYKRLSAVFKGGGTHYPSATTKFYIK